MTNTLEIVPASIVADSPFIDKKASPIIGKNVKFKPTPKPIAKPFLPLIPQHYNLTLFISS